MCFLQGVSPPGTHFFSSKSWVFLLFKKVKRTFLSDDRSGFSSPRITPPSAKGKRTARLDRRGLPRQAPFLHGNLLSAAHLSSCTQLPAHWAPVGQGGEYQPGALPQQKAEGASSLPQPAKVGAGTRRNLSGLDKEREASGPLRWPWSPPHPALLPAQDPRTQASFVHRPASPGALSEALDLHGTAHGSQH